MHGEQIYALHKEFPLSAVIITYNEEEHIEKCLASLVGIADEIIVVDSFSTDKTEEICSKYNVNFIKHKFQGYIEQKNYAIRQAKYNYILSLDGDEALSEKLKKSIIDIKITSFFGEDEILGSFLSKMLPIISALYFLKNENRFNLKSLIFVTAIIISIFLTSERAAFIQALMFLTLFFIFGNFKKKILFFICLIVPLFLGVLVITNFDDNKKQRMIKSPIANLKQGRISSHHQSHFITGINMFKDQIMIGHGPKTFRILCKKYKHDDQSCSNHPHNTYIQLLAETGILGFGIVAFLFLFISSMLIKNLYIKLRHSINVLNNDIISILCGIFVYIWPISPHGNFFNNWLSGMLFLQIAILIFLNSIKFVKLNK